MTQWLRINLLIGLLALLAGCGGTTADSGAQPVPGGSAAVPAPSTSVFVPAPSTSAAAVTEPSTSADAVTEPSSAPSAATSTSASSVAASDVVATFTRSGGFQGKTQTLVVNADGTLQLQNGDRTGQVFKTAQAPADQVAALSSLVTSPEWQQLESKYGQQVPDGFAYTISAQGKAVATFDGASNPAVLENGLTQLNELWQVAQTAP